METQVSGVGGEEEEEAGRAEPLITCKYHTHGGRRCLRGQTKLLIVDQLLWKFVCVGGRRGGSGVLKVARCGVKQPMTSEQVAAGGHFSSQLSVTQPAVPPRSQVRLPDGSE